MFSFIILTAAFWLLTIGWFAIVQKPIFAAYNRRANAEPIGLRNLWQVYRRGLVSDAIVASYLSALPLLTGWIFTLIPGANPLPALTVCNVVAALAVGLLSVADTSLYRFWQFKLDASVFAYLRKPKGAMASVSGGYLAVWTLSWLLLSALYFAPMQWTMQLCYNHLAWPATLLPWWGYPLELLLLAAAIGLLFLVIRGVSIRPNNPSIVYFSSNQWLNHWALNPGYNLIYSLSTRTDFGSQFQSMAAEECRRIVEPLFPTAGTPQQQLFTTDRPNVVLIVWESFSASLTSTLGSKPDVTPCFDRLAAEGVLFSRCTAGSFRTDRGLVCSLSGYPAQPTTSIIRYTRKLPNLPGLARTFRRMGYNTEAIHGGDLSIMHKSDYYLASGHDRLVSIADFPSDAERCKWGVHDGPVFNRLSDEIDKLSAMDKPWFITLQTLSSHEPFAVPYSRLADPVDNAFAYTDHSLGQFIERFKQTPQWRDTLVIIVADHGLNVVDIPMDRASYAHIPLLIAGGAVKAPCTIDTIMSQTDIAATLLGQLGIDHSDFTFSRDVLADTYISPMAFHAFYNGFMVVDPEGNSVYDTLSDSVISGDDPERVLTGKAILQTLYSDIAQR